MPRAFRCAALLVILMLVGLSAAACSDGTARPPRVITAIEGLRVVSLSPALSRTLVDLGLENRIVGCSRFCDFLDTAVPVVGDLTDIDYERLLSLDPTHVVVQAAESGIDARLVELAEAYGWHLALWTKIDTVDDIERVVRELPSALGAPGSPALETLTRRSADLLNEIAAALVPATPGATPPWRGRTLIVYSIEPVGVFGRETYLSEVLGRLGAENAATVTGWKEIGLEDVTRLNPGAIIVVHSVDDTRSGATPGAWDVAGVLTTLQIDAVRTRRIAVLTHADAWRPCTGIIGVAAEMQAILRALGPGP